MTARTTAVPAALAVALVLGVLLAVALGSTPIPPGAVVRAVLGLGGVDPSTAVIVWEVRLPRVVTAVLAGAALGVAGAQLQTLLRNPLAEPYLLGVSSGASLGVAVVVLLAGTAGGAFAAGLAGPGRAGLVAASAAGAALVLGLVLTLARWTRSVATLLIIGVMVGSVVTALVSLMLALADAEQARRYILWGLGSFSGTGWADLAWFAPVALLGIAAALALAKPLNALLLGETYARTMGVEVRTVRRLVILTGSLLAGAVTAFCGPVAFLGLAVPHLARVAVGSAEHRVLLPTAALMGGLVAVLCGTAAALPGTGAVLPLNVVTSVIGGPVVVAALLRSRAADQEAGP